MKHFDDASTTQLVREVIPHRATRAASPHFARTMAALCLSHSSVVALEIARTEHGKRFLLRANSTEALDYLVSQIQARYPLAEIREVKHGDDPFFEADQALVSGVELFAGAAVYQLLRTFERSGREDSGADPLLGVLSSLDQVPSHLRVVAQLALSPLPVNWARAYQRLAHEHPLAEEQWQRRRAERPPGSHTVSWSSLILLGTLALVLTLWNTGILSSWVPPFLQTVLLRLLRGEAPGLTLEQTAMTLGMTLGALFMSLLFLRLCSHIVERLTARPFYDQRKVALKLSASAYRARLRLFVLETRKRDQATLSTPEQELWQRMATRIGMWRESMETRRASLASHHDYLFRLVAAYRQYHADAYFVPRTFSPWQIYAQLSSKRHKTRLGGIVPDWAYGIRRSHLYLSGEEVGMLWHLPEEGDLVDLSSLESRSARTLPVPRVLTTGTGAHIGQARHAGDEAPVFFPPEELFRHMFILGRTGKGKSTLFEHLTLAAEIHPKRGGLCVVEPHGDLILRVVSLLAPDRASSMTVIDLANQETPPGINPLDMTQARSTDRLASTLVMTLKHIWSPNWGPRIEILVRFAARTLLEANESLVHNDPEQGPDQQYSLLDVVPLLTQSGFRKQVLTLVKDLQVAEWWRSFYDRLSPEEQMEIATPVILKISAYAGSPTARRIVGQPRSTLSIQQLVEQEGVLLVNTARGKIGQEISSLIGGTILGLFAETLTEQLSRPEADRRRWMLLVDEFRNYPANYEQILTELRKARLSMVLAAQSLAQLDGPETSLCPIVLGNADHLFIFTLAGEDAASLKHELGKSITPEDVVTLPDYTCYARFLWRRKKLPFFSFELALPPEGDLEKSASLLTQRGRLFGRPSASVDAELEKLARRYQPPSRHSGRGKGSGKSGGASSADSSSMHTSTEKPPRKRKGRHAPFQGSIDKSGGTSNPFPLNFPEKSEEKGVDL